MLGSRIGQEAISGRDTYQSGRDTNVSNIFYAPIDLDKFEIYEEDIKNTIEFFKNTIDGLSDNPFPDNAGILIEQKNEINNLSEECFNEINNRSLAYFGKIRAFFKEPTNSIYVDMYYSTTTEIQQIINAIKPQCDNFDQIFALLYKRLLAPYRETDVKYMRIRVFVYVFLHFMYYNCDIGKKVIGELS